MEISSSAGELFCEGTSNELSVPLIAQAQYEWKFNNNVITGVTGNTYTTTQSGTYIVSVRNSYSCTGTSNSLTIKQVKQPLASFNEIASSCLNEQIQFENTSTYDQTETPVFSWDFGDGTFSSVKNPSHTYAESGTFKVILEVGYSNTTTCTDTYEATLSIAPFLDLKIMANGESIPNGLFNLCDGNTAELSVNAQNGQVEWSTGETTAKISIKDAGIYSVISGKNTGCSSSDEIEAVLVDNVQLVITSGSQRIESGSSAQLGAEGADFYLWDPADDLDDPNIPNPLASPLVTTDYTVLGWNSAGCEKSEMVTVYVDEKISIPVDAPKAFTPNGDGMNDIWVIKNIDVYESCPIRIFNRRGQNVYEAATYNNDWDGILNGKELPEGAYYYILSCGASEVHTGNITLLR
jgi:gliding motility-associated-like protein